MSDQAPSVQYYSENDIAWIVFNNPARMNALTANMWREVPALIDQASNDSAIRILILRGQGEKAFSAGADISEFETARTGNEAETYNILNNQAFSAIENSPKPTIAMINGFCLGGGLELAVSCDLRIAEEGSIFAIPAAKLGIGYDARWVKPLVQIVGAAFAKEILFTGRRYSHNEALDMGLVNQLVPKGTLEETTRTLADEIAKNAPLTIRAAKCAINELSNAPENPDMDKLDQLVEACFKSEDYVEGRKAFKEKRKPVFQGI